MYLKKIYIKKISSSPNAEVETTVAGVRFDLGPGVGREGLSLRDPAAGLVDYSHWLNALRYNKHLANPRTRDPLVTYHNPYTIPRWVDAGFEGLFTFETKCHRVRTRLSASALTQGFLLFTEYPGGWTHTMHIYISQNNFTPSLPRTLDEMRTLHCSKPGN